MNWREIESYKVCRNTFFWCDLKVRRITLFIGNNFAQKGKNIHGTLNVTVDYTIGLTDYELQIKIQRS